MSSSPSARAELDSKATTGLPFQAMQNAIIFNYLKLRTPSPSPWLNIEKKKLIHANAAHMLSLNQKSHFNWLNTSLLDTSFTQTQSSAETDNCFGYRSLNLTLNINHVSFKLSSDLLRKFGNAQAKSCFSEIRRPPSWS